MSDDNPKYIFVFVHYKEDDVPYRTYYYLSDVKKYKRRRQSIDRQK